MAGKRSELAADDAGKGGFAAPGLADERSKLLRVDAKVNVSQNHLAFFGRFEAIEAVRDIFDQEVGNGKGSLLRAFFSLFY